MPPYLKQRFDPLWEGSPPHMSKEDFEIFKRGKALLFQNAVNIYYDVGLGGQTDIPEDTEDSLKSMWNKITQKRIDVLIETADQWHIVEIRPRATSTAAGRLLQYKDMWLADPQDSKPFKLILMTDTPDPDLIPLLKTLNIELVRA